MTENAKHNLALLAENPYPGRGIIVGLDDTGKNMVQIYWIMGRSENSRNRIFEHDKDGRLLTVPADPTKVKDPSLIIYNAMLESVENFHSYRAFVVSNGCQTNDITLNHSDAVSFYHTMDKFIYEPDAPNFTPRISAISYREETFITKMSILKRSSFGDGCDRAHYFFNQFEKGFGHCITTYDGDGDPLPSFSGVPYLLPLAGDIDQIAETMWDVLNEDNRISLAVKFIDVTNGESTIKVINKFNKIPSSERIIESFSLKNRK